MPPANSPARIARASEVAVVAATGGYEDGLMDLLTRRNPLRFLTGGDRPPGRAHAAPREPPSARPERTPCPSAAPPRGTPPGGPA